MLNFYLIIMKKLLNNPYLSLSARLIVGVIFLIASITKIANPETFAMEIGRYNLMPDCTLNIFALILPWVELITSLFLIAGIRLRASSIITAAMLLMFIGAVGLALFQGLNIECGCHTQLTSNTVGPRKIIENSIFFILTMYIFFFPVNKLTLEYLAIKEVRNF
jgi:putative oxidoreductase